MKHIVIDARLYGPKHTGLGRYTKNLLLALKEQSDFKKYQFTLLVYPELLEEISHDLTDNYRYVTTSLKHYSLLEQIFLPVLLSKLKPDLVHFTHLDKPILYFGKSVVTVHDLIRHMSKGSNTTTHSSFLYWFKYLGYLLMTKIIFLNSYLIVPSHYWQNYIVDKYNFPPSKIITTYEAVDPNFHMSPTRNSKLVTGNYIIYTGNLYPHKNIIVVIEALKLLPKLKLKIICARSVFQSRLEKIVKKNQLEDQVEFLGYVNDRKFKQIYSQALALIHPSLIEGFSLTGLEAMALNCPVISSNSSCLPEIYGESVLYFDPYQPHDLVEKITQLQNDPKLRQQLINKGQQQIKKYSWSSTATQTLDFYSNII